MTTIDATGGALGSYTVIYTMTDIADSNLFETVVIDLEVINDVCDPSINVANIVVRNGLMEIHCDSYKLELRF